ncbi:MAG: hypothetical protein PHO61_00165 [Candidatus ainarchaeum sp.]|nr:hypothetical protein [Candidatus ainarchaeum sp.]
MILKKYSKTKRALKQSFKKTPAEKPLAQGALEYLMLIAASIVVVAIVISFISSSIGPIQKAGNQQQYDFMCNTLNVQSFECGCYLCDSTISGVNEKTGIIETPGMKNCKELAIWKDEPLLGGCTNFK